MSNPQYPFGDPRALNFSTIQQPSSFQFHGMPNAAPGYPSGFPRAISPPQPVQSVPSPSSPPGTPPPQIGRSVSPSVDAMMISSKKGRSRKQDLMEEFVPDILTPEERAIRRSLSPQPHVPSTARPRQPLLPPGAKTPPKRSQSPTPLTSTQAQQPQSLQVQSSLPQQQSTASDTSSISSLPPPTFAPSPAPSQTRMLPTTTYTTSIPSANPSSYNQPSLFRPLIPTSQATVQTQPTKIQPYLIPYSALPSVIAARQFEEQMAHENFESDELSFATTENITLLDKNTRLSSSTQINEIDLTENMPFEHADESMSFLEDKIDEEFGSDAAEDEYTGSEIAYRESTFRPVDAYSSIIPFCTTLIPKHYKRMGHNNNNNNNNSSSSSNSSTAHPPVSDAEEGEEQDDRQREEEEEQQLAKEIEEDVGTEHLKPLMDTYILFSINKTVAADDAVIRSHIERLVAETNEAIDKTKLLSTKIGMPRSPAFISYIKTVIHTHILSLLSSLRSVCDIRTEIASPTDRFMRSYPHLEAWNPDLMDPDIRIFSAARMQQGLAAAAAASHANAAQQMQSSSSSSSAGASSSSAGAAGSQNAQSSGGAGGAGGSGAASVLSRSSMDGGRVSSIPPPPLFPVRRSPMEFPSASLIPNSVFLSMHRSLRVLVAEEAAAEKERQRQQGLDKRRVKEKKKRTGEGEEEGAGKGKQGGLRDAIAKQAEEAAMEQQKKLSGEAVMRGIEGVQFGRSGFNFGSFGVTRIADASSQPSAAQQKAPLSSAPSFGVGGVNQSSTGSNRPHPPNSASSGSFQQPMGLTPTLITLADLVSVFAADRNYRFSKVLAKVTHQMGQKPASVPLSFTHLFTPPSFKEVAVPVPLLNPASSPLLAPHQSQASFQMAAQRRREAMRQTNPNFAFERLPLDPHLVHMSQHMPSSSFSFPSSASSIQQLGQPQQMSSSTMQRQQFGR